MRWEWGEGARQGGYLKAVGSGGLAGQMCPTLAQRSENRSLTLGDPSGLHFPAYSRRRYNHVMDSGQWNMTKSNKRFEWKPVWPEAKVSETSTRRFKSAPQPLPSTPEPFPPLSLLLSFHPLWSVDRNPPLTGLLGYDLKMSAILYPVKSWVFWCDCVILNAESQKSYLGQGVAEDEGFTLFLL